MASQFLAARGALIIERNVRIGTGEIDIITSVNDEPVAIEVKTLVEDGEHVPIDHFDDAKQRQVRSLAARRGIGRVDYVGVTVSRTGVTIRWLPWVC